MATIYSVQVNLVSDWFKLPEEEVQKLVLVALRKTAPKLRISGDKEGIKVKEI